MAVGVFGSGLVEKSDLGVAGFNVKKAGALYEKFGYSDLVHPVQVLPLALDRVHAQHVDDPLPEEHHHEPAGGVDDTLVLALGIPHVLLVQVVEHFDGIKSSLRRIPANSEVLEPVSSNEEQVGVGILRSQPLQH